MMEDYISPSMPNLNRFWRREVLARIGSVLLIIAILGLILSLFFLGDGAEDDYAPNTEFVGEYNESSNRFVVRHAGGNELTNTEVYYTNISVTVVVYRNETVIRQIKWADSNGEGVSQLPISVGDSIIVPDVHEDDYVRLIITIDGHSLNYLNKTV